MGNAWISPEQGATRWCAKPQEENAHAKLHAGGDRRVGFRLGRSLARVARPCQRAGDPPSGRRSLGDNRGRLPDSPLVRPGKMPSPPVVPVSRPRSPSPGCRCCHGAVRWDRRGLLRIGAWLTGREPREGEMRKFGFMVIAAGILAAAALASSKAEAFGSAGV